MVNIFPANHHLASNTVQSQRAAIMFTDYIQNSNCSFRERPIPFNYFPLTQMSGAGYLLCLVRLLDEKVISHFILTS